MDTGLFARNLARTCRRGGSPWRQRESGAASAAGWPSPGTQRARGRGSCGHLGLAPELEPHGAGTGTGPGAGDKAAPRDRAQSHREMDRTPPIHGPGGLGLAEVSRYQTQRQGSMERKCREMESVLGGRGPCGSSRNRFSNLVFLVTSQILMDEGNPSWADNTPLESDLKSFLSFFLILEGFVPDLPAPVGPSPGNAEEMPAGTKVKPSEVPGATSPRGHSSEFP
ncbi:uncharacterized protein LOC121342104 isoform X2 [Onychostruthus taczanowskii]|uniref:uncharacterized protein LOC121342104 isoform X2 n=1 Tax=Onychostruthus taczanowskii TaxID=356909 RepID=UPI001B809362|nr:uncharacterized protein LOC121342104 isoform X2 [Onychostruthus taczanowskii]